MFQEIDTPPQVQPWGGEVVQRGVMNFLRVGNEFPEYFNQINQ